MNTEEKQGTSPQEENINKEKTAYIKMDWNLKTPEERVKKVEEIIADTPREKLTPYYLEKMADYILFAATKQKEKKEKGVLDINRMATVDKRELSFEGLVDKLESGESAVHNIIANDKNIIFAPKNPITKKDLDTIPFLKEVTQGIKELEELAKNKIGREAYFYKQWIIDMRKLRYLIRDTYKKPIRLTHSFTPSSFGVDLEEKIYVDEKDNIQHKGKINLFDPKHVSALLNYYAKIKEDTYDDFTDDFHWLIEDLETYTERALEDKYPMYYDLLTYKIDGMKNIEIQEKLYEDYGIKHSVEYISALWRNKIPKLIAEQAENDWLIWYYTMKERGQWKRCNRCGQIKLANNRFFSRNNTSKDGWYSICKECRNKKYKEDQQKKKEKK